MKKIALFLTILLFLSLSTSMFAQTTNDYRTQATGDWTNTATWERYDGVSWVAATAYPGETAGNAQTVTILNTHTVIIDTDAAAATNVVIENGGILEYQDRWNGELHVSNDLTINSGGIFRVTQSATSDRSQNLYIDGNMTVNGTVDGYFDNAGNEGRLFVYFQGATDNTLSGSGTCEIYELTINKGTSMDNILEVTMPITLIDAGSANGQALNIENGTFKLSSASTLKPYYNEWLTITETTGRLWINNAGASIEWNNTVGNATFDGDFLIDAGSFSCPGRILINGTTSGNSYFKNATVNMGGYFDLEQDLLIENSTVTVGEVFYVDGNGADEYGDVIITNSTLSTVGNLESTDASATIQINGASDIDVGGDFVVDGEIVVNDGMATIDVVQGFRIDGSATTNNQINTGTFTIGADFDIEQDLAITGGTFSIGEDLIVDHNGSDEYGDLTFSNATMAVAGYAIITDDGDFIFNSGSFSVADYFRVYSGSTFTINSGDVAVGTYYRNEGKTTLNSPATLTIGDGNDYLDIENNAELEITGGTLNLYGSFDASNGSAPDNSTFTMTGGNFNIDFQHSTNIANNTEGVNFESNTVVNFTGGTMTIVDPHADKDGVSRDALQVLGTAGAKNFEGSTIQFGDGVSSSSGDDVYPGYSIYAASGVAFGNIVLNNPSGTGRQFINRDNTDIYCNNLTITTANDEFQTTGRMLDIKGDFVNNGTLDAGSNDSEVFFTGSTTQTYSGTGTVTNYIPELTFNNTSDEGVILSAPIGAEIVNMTDGHIHTSSTGLLTVYGTDPADLSGYSDANYVIGTLRRAIPDNANVDDYDFPLGTDTDYRLAEMFGISTTGSGSGFITGEVRAEAVGALATGGRGIDNEPFNALEVYWKFVHDLRSVDLDNVGSVRFTYPVPSPPPVFALAQSNTGIDGTYNAIGRNVVGNTIQSDDYDLTDIAPDGEAYITLAEIEPLRGTYYVGDFSSSVHSDESRFFTNLTVVAEVLRQKFVDDNVVFEMLDTYDDDTETIPIVFDVLSTTMPGYDVTIYPRTGVAGTVTERDAAADDEAIIYIDGISGLIFDGRPGGSGSSDWVISNTRGINSGAAIEFRNDATENTLTYLTLQSDTRDGYQGVVKFGASISTGNDDNTISYCDITGYSVTPKNGILSAGTAGANNSGNIITENNIYDYFMEDFLSHGIHIRENNTFWTITNNRFYQTATRTFNTTEDKYNCAIRVRDGENYTIESNTIGYANSSGTGFTEFTNTSGSDGRFVGILFEENTGNSPVSSIANNIFSNIKLSTYSTNTDNGFFNAISVRDGFANITGNTIGTTGNFTDYPIQIENLTDNGQVICIFTDTNEDIEISNNNIGGIQLTGDNRIYFMGIQTANGNADYLVSNNTIGSTTKANSIAVGEAGYSDNADVYGIWNFRAEDIVISNNIIANMTSYFEDEGIYGIYSGTNHNNDITITGNRVYMLTGYSDDNWSSGINACVIGIMDNNWHDDPTIISQNEVHSLRNLATGDPHIQVVGIVLYAAGDNMIDGNFVHNLNTASANGRQQGIYIGYGDATVQNNMVQLGFDENGNTQTAAIEMYGIYNGSSDYEHNYFHNSVYIGGSGVTGSADNNSAALFYDGNTSYQIKNNILVNERSNTSGELSKHYALQIPYDITVEMDYNIYHATGNGGYLANIDGNEFDLIQGIQWYTNYKEMHSGQGDPQFINPTGDASSVSLKLQATTPAEGTGVEIAAVTTDFEGDVRASNTPFDIGADAGNYTFDASVDIFAPTFEYTAIDPQNCGITSVDFDVTIKDFTVGVDNTNKPRVWYRNKTTPGTWQSVEGTLQSGDATNGVWRFTLTGLTDSKFYEYYVVAQDAASTPNIAYSKFDDNSPIHTNVATQSTAPDSDVDIDIFTVCVYPKALYTVGNATDCPTCDFETLTAYGDFFFNMNSMIIDKDVTCQIMADTDEPATYGAEQTVETGAGNWTIRVEAGAATMATLSTGPTINKAQIRLEGGDRYVFDGQFGGDGNRWLTFAHGKDDQPVFQFYDDAQNNQLQYLDIKGNPYLSSLGTIYIEEGSSSGNDNNIIQNNHITNSVSGTMPANAIYSGSTLTDPGLANSNMQIKNNLISDFSGCGIWATADGNDGGWLIQANTMYNAHISDRDQNGIRIEAGSGHTITGNRIGGAAADNSGTWENNDQTEFNGIYLDIASDIKTIISNNVVQNIYQSNTGWTHELRGIRVAAGWADITNNTVQGLEKNGLNNMHGISYTGTEPTNISDNTIKDLTLNRDHDMYGIYVSTGTSAINTVSNNTFTGISLTDDNTGSDFYGIYIDAGAANATLNTFGGTDANAHITIDGGEFTGIYMDYDNTTDLLSFDNNTFSGITITRNSTDSDFTGIEVDNGNVGLNNNVFGGTDAGDKITITGGDFTGIYINGNDAEQDITNNSFTNIEMGGEQTFNGIQLYNLGDNLTIAVENNVVDNITLTNTGAGTHFYAFNLHDGLLDFKNNTVGTATHGISNAGSGNTFGIYLDEDYQDEMEIFQNSMTNITGGGAVSGIYADMPSTNNLDLLNIYSNSISAISGEGDVVAIYTNADGDNLATQQIYDNTISGLSINEDITFTAIKANQGTVNIYENTIDDITLSNTGSNTGFKGIWVSGGEYTVSSNTLFNLKTAGAGGTNIIDITSTTGGTFDVSSNSISSVEATADASLRAINLEVGGLTTVNVDNNTIFDFKNKGTGDNTHLTGVQLYNSGKANITNNLFGNPAIADDFANEGDGHTNGVYMYTGASGGSITGNTLTNFTQGGDDYLIGINVSLAGTGDATQINNNVLQSFKNTSTGSYASMKGIKAGTGSNGKFQITNNLLTDFEHDGNNSLKVFEIETNTGGNEISDNSIQSITNNGIKETVVFYIDSDGDCTLDNNNITDINATNWHSHATLSGMEIAGNGAHAVSNNNITDLSAKTTKADISSGEVALQGIYARGDGSFTITENTISDISLSQNAANHIAGFAENAPNAVFTNNYITNLTNTYTSPVSDKTVNGVLLTSLNNGYIANNFISLGNDDNASYRGVWVAADDAAATKQIYFNSIYIGGTATGSDSYAFLRSNVDAPLYLRNNIFSNFRTGGSAKHYAVATENTTWDATYAQANGFYSSDPSTTGLWGTTDVDYDTWIANTGGDDMELSNNKEPLFADPANNDLHIDPADACAFNSVGEAIAGITTDIDGQSRAAHPDIGADEFTPTGRSGQYVWRGWSDEDWDADGNWQCEVTPIDNPGELIIIPNSTNNPIIKRSEPAASVLANAMNILNNGQLTINPNNSLELSGNFTLNGELIVVSNADGTGSFIDNGTITGTGTATVQRHLIPFGWHYISSPISGVSNKVFTEDLDCYSYNRNLIAYNENYTSEDPTDPDDWQNGWDWQFYTPNNNPFEIVRGYAAYIDNSCRTTVLFNGSAANLNTGDKSITVTNKDDGVELNGMKRRGWNLIGNPYPSHLDADAFISANNSVIDGAIYFWDEIGSEGFDKDGSDYACWNGAGTVGTGSGSVTPDGYVCVGQAFFVHKTATGSGTVNFDNTMRTNNSAHFFKKRNTIQRFKLAITNSDGLYNEILIAFTADASNGFDTFYDARKMLGNPNLAFYSLLSGDAFAIQTFAPIQETSKIVPLGLLSKVTGLHTFSVASTNNLNSNVYLEDIQNDTIINLLTNPEYEFTTDSVISNNDRFVLRFALNNPPFVNTNIPNQTVYEDNEFNISIPKLTFLDNDLGDELNYEAKLANGQDLPDWLDFNDQNMTFTGIPANEDVGEIQIRLYAMDILGETVYEEFVLTIANINDVPYITDEFEDVELIEKQAFNFVINNEIFKDIDENDELTYSALSNGSELPEWLNFNSQTLTFFGTPDGDSESELEIEIIATDTEGANVSGWFTITVEMVNDPPHLNYSIQKQTIQAGRQFIYTFNPQVFADADKNDTLDIAFASDLPNWLDYDSENMVFTGVPMVEDVGETTLIFKATDSAEEFVTIDIVIEVVNNNQAPFISQELTDIEIEHGELLQINLTNAFNDNDTNEELTYSVMQNNGTSLPDWLFYNPDLQILYGVPGQTDTGSISIKVIASDLLNDTCQQVFSIKVVEKNNPPQLNIPLDNKTVETGKNFIFTLPEEVFIDIDDNDSLTYNAQLFNGDVLPQWLNFDDQYLQFTGISEQTDTITVKVTATDRKGESIFDIFNLYVIDFTGIETLNNQFNCKIYPNPAKDMVFIQTNQKCRMTVFDSMSKTVIFKELKNRITGLDVSGLSAGVYVVKIQFSQIVMYKKLIIN